MKQIQHGLALYALVLSSILATGCASFGNNGFQKIPAKKDWSLDGSVQNANILFRVKEERVYGVGLEYPYKEGDRAGRALLWKQVGGSFKDLNLDKWVEPGAPIIIHMKLWRYPKEGTTRELVVEKEVKNPQLSSWGGDSLSSELLRANLTPGHYEAEANLVQGSETLKGVEVRLKVVRAYVGK